MATSLRVLFATAEFAPLARVGGLAEAASGLVSELRNRPGMYGVEVDVVMPDYGDVELDDETSETIAVPAWAGDTAILRRGIHCEVGPVTLVTTTGTRKPHPYTDVTGFGWPDNDVRFFGFAATVGALADRERPDVLHLNDWHAAGAVGFMSSSTPTVLTIHTLGYQGVTSAHWRETIPYHRDAFVWYDVTNPLVAAIRTADKIIAVSPNYAREITTPEFGAGHHLELGARGDDLVGIRNGIDVAQWNPETDPYIASNYVIGNAARAKAANQRALLERVGLPSHHESDDPTVPVIGVVSRLVDQKGIDLLLDIIEFLPTMEARLVVLGSGDATLANALAAASKSLPRHVSFHDGYDAELAHQIFAGADLFAMPSRFEPCGLAQMQAMSYGTIPVVTPVGGLIDTVTDAYDRPEGGTGVVARSGSTAALTDALHRAVQLWRIRSVRHRIRKNGMRHDWSWQRPADEHVAIYRDLAGRA